jgi:RNA polymerase sigma-70 factor (ECF subfamily)
VEAGEQLTETDSADAARFTRAFDEHHTRVYAYATSRVGRQFAEEVVSETYLVAWRRIADLPEPPLAYLIGIARNVILAQYRRTVSDEAVRAELRAWAATPVTGDIADDVVERGAMLHALAQLSEADRELLTLVAWQGLSTAQAAEALGCTRTSYSVRLHRARRRLEQILNGTPAASSLTHRTLDVQPAVGVRHA